MSDRREAVARAIGNALITRSDIAAVADAAIAAYESTEPTEAEVDEAMMAYLNVMSDRREAVARAIWNATPLFENYDTSELPLHHLAANEPLLHQRVYDMADAAIAVIDAEPTEAEIAILADCLSDALGSYTDGDLFNFEDMARRALTEFTAARTARQGGER